MQVDNELPDQLNGPYLTGPAWFRCGKTVKKTAPTAATVTTVTISNSTVLTLGTPNISSTSTSSTDTVVVVMCGNQDGNRTDC